MIASGNRLLVLSLVLTTLVLAAAPVYATFERGVRIKAGAAESTYVKIDVEDPNEATNPGGLGTGVVSPGDKVRLLIHLQNTHNAGSTVNAKRLHMLGEAAGFHALDVVTATDEVQADLAVLHPGVSPAYFPNAGNTGDGTFAAAPVPDTSLWIDVDYLEGLYVAPGEVGAAPYPGPRPSERARCPALGADRVCRTSSSAPILQNDGLCQGGIVPRVGAGLPRGGPGAGGRLLPGRAGGGTPRRFPEEPRQILVPLARGEALGGEPGLGGGLPPGPPPQQQLYYLAVPGGGGDHQGGQAAVLGGVDLGALVQ